MPDETAPYAPRRHSAAVMIAPPPIRRSPPRMAITPSTAPASASTSGSQSVRSMIGGSTT